MNKLLDSWNETGNDIQEMYQILTDLSESTHIKTVRSDNLQILTVYDINDENLMGFLHAGDSPENTCIPLKEMRELHGADEEILAETNQRNKWMLKIGDSYYYASLAAVLPLGLRADISGRALISTNQKMRFYRDAFLKATLDEKAALPCNVVYRQKGDAKKIFYFGSDRFNGIPQGTVIKDTIRLFENEMGKAELKKYQIDNFASVIYIEFPDKAEDFKRVYCLQDDIVPGAWICTSDVGDSSYIVNGTIRVDKAVTFVPNARYARQHTKNASVEKIMDALDKSIFPEYRTVPERLAELIMIDIPDPASTIKNVAKAIDLKGIGLKAEKKIVEEMLLSVNPRIPYTAYDIAKMFLAAGADAEENSVSATKDIIAKMRNIFVQAVFYKYA